MKDSFDRPDGSIRTPDGRRTAPTRVRGGTFVVVASGSAEGPSQALRRFLVERGAARVIEVSHPLVAEVAGEHVVTDWRMGAPPQRTVRRRPNRPPLTYAFDPFTPIVLPRCDAFFGFNCLATAQGLALRSLRRADKVVHWSVDFVPNRFGPGVATRVYEWVDRLACVRSDGRVDLSQVALDARSAAYRLDRRSAPGVVIPMGAWLDESPHTGPEQLARPRVAFLGHLVERMGVGTFIDAMSLLRERGIAVEADIIGGGPLLDDVRRQVDRLGLAEAVTVHGFVADFADVQRIVAGAVIAVAPYEPDPDSFSRFADPGKLKAYLAAGLPILLTDVPPNAAELAAEGGAGIVAASSQAFADGIAGLLAAPTEWEARHRAALRYTQAFDWNVLLGSRLRPLNFESDA